MKLSSLRVLILEKYSVAEVLGWDQKDSGSGFEEECGPEFEAEEGGRCLLRSYDTAAQKSARYTAAVRDR